MFRALGIALVPVNVAQADAARVVFAQFGEGRQRAGLNDGDCFAYALAMTHGHPLLFKGDDFHTRMCCAPDEPRTADHQKPQWNAANASSGRRAES